jgi:hypothetical protein
MRLKECIWKICVPHTGVDWTLKMALENISKQPLANLKFVTHNNFILRATRYRVIQKSLCNCKDTDIFLMV